MRWVAGVDEAGRGALAGPLVAASVVLDIPGLVGPDAAPLGRLDDSKRLTAQVREELLTAVLAVARSVTVVVVAPGTIDAHGLHRCNLEAMERAIRAHDVPIDAALVDGFELGEMPVPCTRLIKGDATSAAVAASAIVAKVTRDRLMRDLDAATGHRWAFADHMGYATPLHAERIQLHGVSNLHRRSYNAAAYEGAPEAVLATPILVE